MVGLLLENLGLAFPRKRRDADELIELGRRGEVVFGGSLGGESEEPGALLPRLSLGGRGHAREVGPGGLVRAFG
jgi:hypothetical protein